MTEAGWLSKTRQQHNICCNTGNDNEVVVYLCYVGIAKCKEGLNALCQIWVRTKLYKK